MHHRAAHAHDAIEAALETVTLPASGPDRTPYVEYGDTSGALGHCDSGGDQVLPSGLVEFYRAQGTNPTRIDLTMFGDADLLRGHAAGGNDTLQDFAFSVVAVGDARVMQGQARGGDDTIHPNGTFLALFGDALVMAEQAAGGDDVMRGGTGITARPFVANDMYGDAYAMLGRSQGGDDVITGGGAYPGAQNRLYGDAYSLAGHARAGDDTLIGGQSAHNDMWGDAAVIEGHCVITGHDVFVITPTSGINIIHDFEPGRDRIDLTAFAAQGIHGPGDLEPYRTADAEGSRVLFSSTPGGPGGPPVEISLTVLGDQDLAACDFLFA
jgi:hypothetical protein